MKPIRPKMTSKSRKTTVILMFFVFYCSIAALSKEQIYSVQKFKKELLGHKEDLQGVNSDSSLEAHKEDLNSQEIPKDINKSISEEANFAQKSVKATVVEDDFSSNKMIMNFNNSNNRNEEAFEAIEKQGQIGVFSDDEEDKISDNFFTINIPKQSEPIAAAYLTYDLFGLASHESVPRSINQNPALGGNVIEAKYAWSNQKENINLNLLKEGKNTILFTPPSAGIKYKVKNVKIVFEHTSTVKNIFSSSLLSRDKLCIKGFISIGSDSQILIENQSVNVFRGEFEKTITLNDKNKKDGFVTITTSNGSSMLLIPKSSENSKIIEEESLSPKTILLSGEQEMDFMYEGASIKAEKGTTASSATFTILKLRAKDFPTNNQEIKNVTLDSRAYRISTIGKLDKKIKLSIPYDEKKLGTISPKEIKTFFFDYTSKKWKIDASAKVDEKTKTVTIESNGEGNYINGIISVPESPQLNAFEPTSISGLKAADPTAGMQFISPPSANQKGDANVSYPIIVPSGRNGLQPNLSIVYSSSNGNGWLGEGWDISGLSAINIDTRWGSPKFHDINETELYGLDGEMLVYDGNYLPHRHNDISENSSVFTTEKQKRSEFLVNNKKKFFLRKNHDFTIIERYGANPSEYRWVVTSTDGTKSYYGGDENVVDNQSVVKNSAGKIVHWGLWKIEDVYKNNIKFNYENIVVSGVTGADSNLNGGRFFKIQSIIYTGYNGSNGLYSVDFERESSIGRQDISINAKQGVKRVEPYRLNNVAVKYNGQIIRKYGFEFKQGQFFKTLLDKIYEYDKDNQVSNRYDLEYYDDLKNGTSVINYSADQNINTPSTDAFAILPPALSPSKINATYSYEWGVHGRVPGLGVSILWPTQNPYGHAQASFNIGMSNADAKKAQQLIDFDGDGIQDIIFRKPSNGLYIMNGSLSGNNLSFGSAKKILNLNSNFSQTSTNTHQIGFDAGMSVFGIGFNYSQIWSTSKSETPVFITDSNSDGLMDVVKDGEVWFNKKNSNNIPEMTKFSDQTENMVLVADAVTEHETPLEGWHTISKNDVIKMWVAPKSGYIKFTDNISIENLPNAKAVYSVEIKNPISTNSKNGRIYLKVLTPSIGSQNITINNYNDYFGSIQSLPPSDPNSHWGINSPQKLYVQPGDKVFIRLHKRDNTNFKVFSNPKIMYVNEFGQEILNSEEEEQSGFYLNNGTYSENFVLNNNSKPLTFNEEGTLNISVPTVNFPNSNDKIVFKIVKVNMNTSTETELYNSNNYNLYPQNANSFSTNPITLNNISITSSDLPAAIRFVVETDSHTKFKNSNWNNTDVVFTPLVGPAKSYKGVAGYDSFYITEFRKKINLKETNNSFPQGVQSYGIQINKSLPINPNGLNPGMFYYIVKKGGLVVAKRRVIVTVNNGVQISEIDLSTNQFINGISPIPIYNIDLQNSTIPVDQRINVQVYCLRKSDMDLYKYYSGLFANQPFNIYYGSNNAILSTVSHTSINSGGLAHITEFYNNWGQFLYNEGADVVETKDDPDGFQYNPNTPADYYGRLINIDKIAEITLPSNFNYSQCNSIPANTPDYANVYAQCIADQINNSNVYGGTNMIPQPVTPLNAIKVGTVEKWVGLGSEQYAMADSFKDDETVSDFYTLPTTDPNLPDVILQGNVDTKMYSISKKHYSKSRTRTLSGSLFSASVGNSHSELVGMGSVDLQDFMDLNGDGYPDIVYKDASQLTNSTGGLGALQGPYVNSWLSETDSYQNSISAQFSPDTFKSVGAAFRHGFATALRANSDNSSPWSSGLSGNYDSKDINQAYWLDINGDGLPDRISEGGTSNMTYQINLGYSLGSPEPFSNLTTIASHPVGTAGVSFNTSIIQSLSNFPISAGVSASASLGSSDTTLEDINGDGLLDVLLINSNSTHVRYNLGNKFSAPVTLYKGSQTSIDFNNEAKTYNGGAFIEGHWYKNIPIVWIIIPFIWIPIPIIYFKVGGQLTGQVGMSISEVDKVFKDMNGDGYADLVVSSGGGFTVNHSTIGRTNKLKMVTSIYNRLPLNQFTIDYEFSKPNYNNPHSRLVMKEVKIINPDVNTTNYLVSDPSKDMVKRFRYENSRYDRRERDYFGFETVISEEMSGNSVYRSAIQTFYNNSYFLNGILKKSETFEGNNNLLSVSENIYKLYKFKNNNTQIDLTTPLSESFDTGGKEGRKMAIVLLQNTNSTMLDNGGQIQLSTQVAYNDKGQLIKYQYTSPSTSYNSIITYHNNLNNNISSVPKTIDVYSGNTTTNLLRHRETQVSNLNTGDVSKVIVKLNSVENAETDITYDIYGNITTVTYPHNEAGQRYKLTYTYDSQLSKYVTQVTDVFGITSSSVYNPMFDAITESTDVSGSKMKYTYDAKGRLKSILGPKEVGVSPYTVEYDYLYLQQSQSQSNLRYLFGAVTRNFDPNNPSNPIETISFSDALGRIVQVKKDIELAGVEKMSVSGLTIYDVHGRAIKQYHPLYEDKDNILQYNGIFNSSLSNYSSTSVYDVKDRPVTVTDEDGNVTNSTYSIENNLLKTVVTQMQNSSVQLKNETLANAEGKTVTSKNYLSGQATQTNFEYNHVGELRLVIDPEGIITKYGYDLAGRRTRQSHADHGDTTYEYSKAGQLIRLSTANLQNDPNIQTHHIQYNYEFNRLVEIQMPNLPNGNPNPSNVKYKYGASNTGNQTGRLINKTDNSGITKYTYGNMGEMVLEDKTIYGVNIPTVNSKTAFEYDSWNRIRKITYPDGEKVNYSYDLGGNLKNMIGASAYIENIVYDHYEQRTDVFFGNGIHSTFSYSPTNRRLQSHVMNHANSGNLLNNNYSFDFVGNITNIINSAVQSPNEMGGAYNFNYGYDQLNRLIAASGEFGIERKESGNSYMSTPYAVSNSEFALDMNYTPSGGIDLKNQNHLQNQQTNPHNSYSNRYNYIGGTHKLEMIENQSAGTTEEFKYDENGNVIMHWNPTDGEKNMFWDEQDRMKAFYSNETGTFQYYTYDDKGERIIKYNLKEGAKLFQNGALVDGQMEMIGYKLYPNAYWTLSSDGTRTKHYFAGDQRVASRVLVVDPFMKQSAAKTTDTKEETTIPNPEEDLKIYLRKAGLADSKVTAEFSKAPNTISGLYYLHGDHLGTATYVTDSNGETTQFFLNLPFGETMAEQNLPGTYENPYKFNAKELDVETGLYYYGARYFNPRISLWYGVDALAIYNPVMETEFYGDGQHNGGVFYWGNLNPYIYTYQNPIKYIDPNGKQTLAIHGTWSDKSTWENQNSIRNVAMTAFGNKKSDFNFEWSGDNTSTARTIAAAQLITRILNDRKDVDPSEPVTLVGHSHGGNVAIEAINIMVDMPEFKDVDINLITINTPVRNQYQLNEDAQKRVDHLNVYDPKDPVQANGGGTTVIGNGKTKPTGEFGKAGRTYNTPNTKNIKVKNPQGVTGDFHNSHNRTKDWQDQVQKSNKRK